MVQAKTLVAFTTIVMVGSSMAAPATIVERAPEGADLEERAFFAPLLRLGAKAVGGAISHSGNNNNKREDLEERAFFAPLLRIGAKAIGGAIGGGNKNKREDLEERAFFAPLLRLGAKAVGGAISHSGGNNNKREEELEVREPELELEEREFEDMEERAFFAPLLRLGAKAVGGAISHSGGNNNKREEELEVREPEFELEEREFEDMEERAFFAPLLRLGAKAVGGAISHSGGNNNKREFDDLEERDFFDGELDQLD